MVKPIARDYCIVVYMKKWYFYLGYNNSLLFNRRTKFVLYFAFKIICFLESVAICLQ